MESAIQTVVAGEASESDDDEPSVQTPKKQSEETVPIQSAAATKAVVVSGEASESDEEIETSQTKHLPPLNVDKDSKADEDLIIVDASSIPGIEKAHLYGHGTSKYDSLLHRKLRERNIAFRRHLVDSVHQVYISSSKDLHNIRLQLHKTQGALNDVSHNMSLLTNDLFKLDNTLDTVSTCTILPDIKFPQ
ncbi:biogenesis of lysosome-related organelles complex 1 subunit 3 [Mytilus galloprovincialis]|uniref:Biogenesis of lysosome-related organelles complex 1 subunit 3 n=1 Tax=Mytilus galloprovincialis TaxID=29158 RepID=A0A8B6G530_MYTGA|nr:biogenesis of lysosome-related organelles complex 1 subunit 3 [Mytilus galloprovincialis]